MFAKVLGEEVIWPEQKDRTYGVKFDGNLNEEKYNIGGQITTKDGPLKAHIIINDKK